MTVPLAEPAIAVQGLGVTYRGQWPRRGRPVTALRDVSVRIPAGSVTGVVGESGSGKSTLGRVLLRLQRHDTGSVQVAGHDPFSLRGPKLLAWRRQVQAVFQDSEASLNPRMTVGSTLREGLEIHKIGTASERDERVEAMLDQVGLAADMAERYPHTLSGGQRQRVNIARALILEPRVLIADEPVSALDVAIQAQILDLLVDLQARASLTVLFISHDLSVVKALCDHLVVLRNGEIVETGPTSAVMDRPAATYTRELIDAVPHFARRGLQHSSPTRLVTSGTR